jgi:ribosomal protein S21
MVQTEGVLREARAHEYFVSRGDAERIKAKKSARRRKRNESMSSRPRTY